MPSPSRSIDVPATTVGSRAGPTLLHGLAAPGSDITGSLLNTSLPSAAAPRNALVDHWKLLLIFLVVLGHVVPGHPVVYAAIYTFHMPAFIFLVGMNSRPRPSWRSQAEIFVLLVVFHAAYFATMRSAGWQTGRWWVQPAYIMWFYASMLSWRLALRPLLWTRWPMLLSIAIALGAGLLPKVGLAYSLSRTCAFLPFFVAGFRYGPLVVRWAEQDRRGSTRTACAALGIVLASTCALLVQDHLALVEARLSYVGMNLDPLAGLLARAGVLGIGAAVSLCFFAAACRPGRWARYGRNTRAVYLLHGFVAIPFVTWMEGRFDPGAASLAVSVVATVVLVAFLAQDAVDRAIGRLLRPLASSLTTRAPRPR